MPGTKDNIYSMLELIESQGFNYFLVIIDDKKTPREEDVIECISNLNEKSLQSLMLFLREYKKEQKKIENKDKTDNKKNKEDDNGKE